jgi:hypothetical protein
LYRETRRRLVDEQGADLGPRTTGSPVAPVEAVSAGREVMSAIERSYLALEAGHRRLMRLPEAESARIRLEATSS